MSLNKTQKELEEIVSKLSEDYIERKRTRNLYKTGLNIPKRLLIFYYQLNKENRHLNDNAESFIKHYIACESILENAHLNFEKQGLKEMYEYLFSNEINENFDIYTLLDLHRKLFSKAPYPEAGGLIRNSEAHIDGAPINLATPSEIRIELKFLDNDLKEILAMQEEVKTNKSYLFTYIDKCIILSSRLIKVHPFTDGNGRTIRAFLNKLFMDVELPPIYISSNENKTYKKAMQKAIGEENDFTSIIKFYYYKICDSIIELEASHKNKTYNKSAQTIMNLVNEIKSNIIPSQIHYSIDEELAGAIKDYLDEQDITSQIFNIAFFEPSLNPHAFVIANYQEGDKIKQLLIDPLFENISKDIKINPYNSNAPFLENLKKYGVSAIDGNELSKYILIFYNLQQSPNYQLTKKFPN